MRANHSMLYLLHELYKLFLIQKKLQDGARNRRSRHPSNLFNPCETKCVKERHPHEST